MKLLCSLSPALSYFQFSLFMQDPENDSNARKPWYQRAMEMGSLWKTISKSTEIIPTAANSTLWKTVRKCPQVPPSSSSKNKLRKCTSLKVDTSFTRVCLCGPISSYKVFRAEVPPRRSDSTYHYQRAKPLRTSSDIRILSAKLSTEGRRVFRGKSLTDDDLMRRLSLKKKQECKLEEEIKWKLSGGGVC